MEDAKNFLILARRLGFAAELEDANSENFSLKYGSLTKIIASDLSKPKELLLTHPMPHEMLFLMF